MASKELHPSLIFAQSEYKIMGVLLVAVLRLQEAQFPLVQYITRELLTCLIMEHVMRLASPERINELIEGICLATNKGEKETVDDQSNLSEPTDVILLDIFGRSNEPTYSETALLPLVSSSILDLISLLIWIPKIEKLEIEGKGFHTNLYAVRGNYSGGKEGETGRIIKHMINLFGLGLSVAPSPAPPLPPSFSSIMQRLRSMW
ncbi:unnamed protein product [Lactuca virosa]|uniref:PXA domain-containing protein n=1 Tax=Lactuca virosa TaxID=75947 RepID=A0AAU9NC27_9ASTR|nr:unnamed protein product [Lactuca virosa]